MKKEIRAVFAVTFFAIITQISSVYAISPEGTGSGGISTLPTVLYTPLYPSVTLSTVTGTLAVSLSWRNISVGETKIKIIKSASGINDITIPITDKSLSVYNDTQVTQGVTYSYTIVSCNTAGQCSAPTTPATIRIPQTSIAAPTNFVAQSTQSNPLSVSLSWNNQTTTGTKIEISRASSGTQSTILSSQILGTITSYTDKVPSSGIYTYTIKACNDVGLCSSLVTTTVTTAVQTVPTVPTVEQTTQATTATTTNNSASTSTMIMPVITFITTPVVTPTKVEQVETVPSLPTQAYGTQVMVNGAPQKSIRVSWVDTSNNETRFKVYRSSLNSNAELPTIPANTTSYEDTNLLPGVYTYYITACNSLGCSSGNTKTNEITITENKVDTASLQETALLLEISNAVGKMNPGTFLNITPLNNGGVSSQSYSPTVLSDGTFKIKIPDGTYVIEGITPVKIVTLVDGKVTTISTKNIVGNKIIVGKVTSSDGTAIANAEIGAYKKETNEWISTTSDSSGKYSLTVSAGNWDISLRVKNGTTVNWTPPKTTNTATFSNEDTNETITSNFTVTTLTSNLTVLVKDENGAPIPSVGIVIDTLNLTDSQKTQTQSRKIITEKTNTDGQVNIITTEGYYFLRTIIPETLNYKENPEMPLTLLINDTKTITITLKKKTVSNTITLTGLVKFDDGKTVDGYVSLWSNEGKTMSVKANTSGTFTAEIEQGQTWHIKASKDIEGKSYISDEQTFISTIGTKSIELIFVRNESVSLPTPVTTSKTAQEQVVVSVDNGARFTLPPNTVTSSSNINVTIKPTTEASSQAAKTLVSTAYDITIKNNEGTKLTKLANDAEILLPYDENELKAKGVALESIIPSYFDESLNTWVSVPNFTINRVKKVFVLHVNHLTRFALIAAADTTAPDSPTNIVTDAITPTDVRISWNNPAFDVNHAKIYRSENPGTFGQVIAAEVFSNSFVDKTGALGKKVYYYTVRAVDAAGNESTNSTQIAATTFNTSLVATAKSPSLLLPPGQATNGSIERVLSLGSKGDDVLLLQKALKYDGFYATGPLTGYYGKLTENAVFRFQNYYKAELLIPNGYKIGTGVLGAVTRKKINEIIVTSAQ